MNILIILSCLVIAAIASPTTPAQSEWRQFKSTHKKTYKNAEEELERFGIFNENLKKIEEHNKLYEQGLVTWSMGVNQFTDWTHDEFAKFLAIRRPSQNNTVGTFVRPENVQIPSAIDWRAKNAVTPVKNQGECGASWAFSTTGSLEGQKAIKTQKLVPLSEQELIDCCYGNMGCFDGSINTAFEYVEKYGLTTEDAYTYRDGEDADCLNDGKRRVVYTHGYHTIQSGNETDLEAAVALIGPISIRVDALSWVYYASGIYGGRCYDNTINHGALAVGYGTDDQGKDYWLIKNSWGANWGEQGYIRLPRHGNICGVASSASYPLL